VRRRTVIGALAVALALGACGSSSSRAVHGAGKVGPFLYTDPTPHDRHDEHWHAAIAANVCGTWQPGPIWPSYTSGATPTLARFGTNTYAGLHTHTLANGASDGLIHMEPAAPDEAGWNATVGRYFEFGGWQWSAGALRLWAGADGGPIVWHDAERCTGGPYAGQPAVIRWALGKHRDGAATRLVEQHSDLRRYKLYDQDVIAIYVLPRDAALTGALQQVPSEQNLVHAGSPTPTSTPPATLPAVAACPRAAQPRHTIKTYARPGDAHLDATKHYRAALATTCGSIVVALDVAHAPKGANNFAFLAESHFYDGLSFHRAVRDFVIQGGDPKGDGTGGPGYTVPTEVPTSYKLGDIAWAKTAVDPDGTAGSQFFIVTGAQGTSLPAQYGDFGTVVAGFAVAKRIESESPGDGPPVVPVYIRSVTITSTP
jgi:cyclophilin family peptidyl-prolyl cis-trans isomerase